MNTNPPRNSTMEIGEVYFWTSTVVYWKKLFETDDYKNILLNSLKNLIERQCIAVYGFVIMPNHIHLIWEMLKYNGKEMPHTSFIKFTAHQFKKELEKSNQSMLNGFKTDKNDRDYQFWQRDALAIRIFSREMLEQKLDYVHDNPMQGKWNLCQNQEDYQWSSAKFYTDRSNGFEFLTHYLERF